MEIKVWGIRLKVHLLFVVMIGLYAVLGLAAQALIIFALVIGHELAHLLTARAYGFQVEGLELFPFGGAAYCNDIFEGRKIEESFIALAGPLFNLLLLFIAQGLRWGGMWTGPLADDFVRYNFWLAAFNLSPVLPLDGGRITRALLTSSLGFVRCTKYLAWGGKWLGVGLGILGIVSFVSIGGNGSGNVFFIMLGVFFWLAGDKEIKTAHITFLRQLTRKKEDLMKKGLMKSRWITVCEETPVVRIVESFSPDYYGLISLIQSGHSEKRKTLTETEVLEGMMKEGIHYPVGRL